LRRFNTEKRRLEVEGVRLGANESPYLAVFAAPGDALCSSMGLYVVENA
jgi:hypothetical protein